jgi:hypothetical protein
MTPLEIWVWVFGALVIGGNIWVYWHKWHRKKSKKS